MSTLFRKQTMNYEQQQLVLDNTGLAHHWARKLFTRLDYEDKVQEGMEAMCMASFTYKPNKGTFGNYASQGIIQRLYAYAANNLYMIRLPHDKFKKLRDFQQKVTDGMGKYAVEIFIATKVVWLNQLTNVEFYAPDDTGKESEDIIDGNNALALLTDREQTILKLRYGWDGEYRSLEKVGKIIGVSREGIRQIEFRALNKVRKVWGVKKN